MSHWPDVERCKKLKEMGYPQSNALFCWAFDYRNRPTVFSMHEYRARYHEYICAAPIVTELVGEIRKIKPNEMLYINIIKNKTWVSRYLSYWVKADTLPGALADLWMELKGENHDT